MATTQSPRFIEHYNPYSHPLHAPHGKIEQEKPHDWKKITAIVFAVIGGLLALAGGASFMGMLPSALLGGKVGAAIILGIGTLILLPAGYTVYQRW